MDQLHELQQRLARLEEAVGFAQHDQDAFSAQLVSLQSDLRALDARLRRVEAAVQHAAKRTDSSAGDDADAQGSQT